MIDRVLAGEIVEEPEKIAMLLKEEYPYVTISLGS